MATIPWQRYNKQRQLYVVSGYRNGMHDLQLHINFTGGDESYATNKVPPRRLIGRQARVINGIVEYQCSLCREFKCLDDFPTRKEHGRKPRVRSACTKCKQEKYNRKTYERHGEKYKQKGREQYANSIELRARTLINGARTRAEKRSIPFDITEEWLIEKINAGHCEATGIPFSLSRQTRRPHRWSPSVDRIDNTLGYTKDNCRVVVWAFNCAKAQLSDDQLAFLAEQFLKTRERVKDR